MGNEHIMSTPIYIPKRRYEAFFNKAKLECKTSDPAHDVLHLLLDYYLENTFVIHRKMKMIEEMSEKEKRKYQTWKRKLKESDKRVIPLKTTKTENRRFKRKVKSEGLTQTYVMNLLIDFYMKKEFIIETKIIRVNR
jgi:hypothetical protein